MPTRKKKESFLVFEDWIRYSRHLTDKEFRQLINNILLYYKNQQPILDTPDLQEVWSEIIDDLNVNLSKKKTQQENGKNMWNNNPRNKNTSTGTNTDTSTDTNMGTNTDTDTGNITDTNTGGMVDGRWDMVDEKMEDEEMGNGNDGIMIDVNKVSWEIWEMSNKKNGLLDMDIKETLKFTFKHLGIMPNSSQVDDILFIINPEWGKIKYGDDKVKLVVQSINSVLNK